MPPSPHNEKYPPTQRKLRVFAYDPSLATELENFDVSEVTITLPWEDLEPGPVGQYLEVVDVDPASGCAYEPVDLNERASLINAGLPPSEGNPQFHQQMVYAVAMNTIRHFERALGRTVLWSDQCVKLPDPVPGAAKKTAKGKKADAVPPKEAWLYTERLRIYPHALREANAFYESDKKALLFGYFPARPKDDGAAMAGGMVFTCLSHDIVAHETTHAILDGANRYLMEPSNPDVLAFHEAFADIVALFQHFTYPEVLKRQISRARGDLSTETLLGQLAVQFGVGDGAHGPLRDAIGGWNPETGKWERRKPNPALLLTTGGAHERGSLLVAAVFDVFIAIYTQRTRDLLRIATGGAGILPPGDLHPDLVNRLAEQAAKTAEHMLAMCIRAIDYSPPVDITFGDFLRAIITADFDLVPDDDRNYRVAFIEAFRKWGIYPQGIRTLSVESLIWQKPDASEMKPFVYGLSMALDDPKWAEVKCGINMEGEPGYNVRQKLKNKEIWERTRSLSAKLHIHLKRKANAAVNTYFNTSKPGVESVNRSLFGLNIFLGHDDDIKFQVETLRPVRRIDADGRTKSDLLVQLVQRRPGYLDPKLHADETARYKQASSPTAPDNEKCDFHFRGGASFIIDLDTYEVRYVVSKSILDDKRLDRERAYRQTGRFTSERDLYFGDKQPQGMRLANLHSANNH